MRVRCKTGTSGMSGPGAATVQVNQKPILGKVGLILSDHPIGGRNQEPSFQMNFQRNEVQIKHPYRLNLSTF